MLSDIHDLLLTLLPCLLLPAFQCLLLAVLKCLLLPAFSVSAVFSVETSAAHVFPYVINCFKMLAAACVSVSNQILHLFHHQHNRVLYGLHYKIELQIRHKVT
jgi:hypothetical protein